jgi:3-hydroxyacyl-CoA dehydrogenase
MSQSTETSPELVTTTFRDGVGIVAINNPPVNALSPGVPEGIRAAVEAFTQDANVQAIVLIGSGRTFIAGADIKEFGKIVAGEQRDVSPIRAMLAALESCPKPVVAAIHGTALGGGLETAMACHYRVAVPSAQVGQPEVKLGLIPGAGGTQRLPRLAGVAKASDMCAFGQPVTAGEALQCGIIDRIVDGDLLTGAIAFAQEIAAAGQPPRRTCELNDKLQGNADNAQALAAVREAVMKRSRGLIAPLKAIEAIEAAISLSFSKGIQRERELFEECLFTDQSKALIHVFFSERLVSKVPGVPKDTPLIPIRRAAVVGAGTMGGGIAMAYATAGIPVLLKEVSQQALDRGMATITKNYAATVKKGRLSRAQMDERLARIQPTLTYDRFSEADIVVEAVFEGMELKKHVFAELDRVARPDAILASNTSTLDIDRIASATSRPQQVIGHHFFSPANVMRLLEIVRGKHSSASVIATSLALAKTLGKVGVLVGNCRGFVGNRMFGAYQREAQFLLEEGARVEQVDAALTDFGMAMGPLAVGDLAGLDVSWRIRKEYKHLLQPGMRQALAADRLCEMGRYGQKTGAGWYKYPDGSRSPVPDPAVEELIVQCAAEAGIRRRTISADEIVERTIYALVNEGTTILAEGFALRASDIDIIYINGYGFPAHRGGPMWYADTVGLAKVYERICEFQRQHGDWWTPAPLLQELAEKGGTFAQHDQANQ